MLSVLVLALPIIGMAAEVTEKAVTIHFPQDVKPEIVYVWYGGDTVSGGNRVQMLDTSKYAQKYTIDLNQYKQAKILVYLGGYKFLPIDLDMDNLSSDIELKFEPQKTVVLRGKLVDTKGKPLANERVSLEYLFSDANLFISGFKFQTMSSIAPIPKLWAGQAVTDNSGVFSLEVPSFLEDPVIASYIERFKLNRGFNVIINGLWDKFVVSPREIPVQTAYPSPTVLTRIVCGKLAVHIDAGFFDQNGIEEDANPYLNEKCGPNNQAVMYAWGKFEDMGIGIPAKWNNGYFRWTLPPGEYELTLEAKTADGKYIKHVIHKGVVVKENDDQVIEIK